MNGLLRHLVVGLAIAASALTPRESAAVAYSVDPASALDPSALYRLGAALDSSAASLGLQSGDNMTSITTGVVGNVQTYFSVDRTSTGVTGSAVRAMSLTGGQAAAVFYAGSADCTPNCLIAAPALLGLGTGDNIDALMGFGMGFASTNFFFTLGRDSPTLATLGASSADILLHRADGSLSIALTAAALGLTASDAIDALEVNYPGPILDGPFTIPEGADLRYSLDRASPTLGGLHSPADLFARHAAIWSLQTAASFGLDATDNIDAIATNFVDPPCFNEPVECPEPATGLVIATAMGALGLARRRRPRAESR